MGIPENHAKHAAHNTGNTSSDMAITWYFENQGKPELDGPLPKVKKAAAAEAGPKISEENVQMLAMMGFPDKRARKALEACDNNPERAAEWLFTHEDDGEDEPMQGEEVKEIFKAGDDTRPGVYNLQSFITHLGSSVHCGHYVAHIKKDKDWVLYNDSKVAASTDPPFGKAYAYFFTKN